MREILKIMYLFDMLFTFMSCGITITFIPITITNIYFYFIQYLHKTHGESGLKKRSRLWKNL